MTAYRKKPVVIDAYQTDAAVEIVTLEGTMRADPGDWIITGVKGERYPCKPDIFAATYEAVTPAPVAQEPVDKSAEMQGSPVDKLPDLQNPQPASVDDLPGMLALAKGVARGDWPHTTDARVWARRFYDMGWRIYKEPGGVEQDQIGTMLAWFANAIMAGYDTAQYRAARSEPQPEAQSEPDALVERIRALADCAYWATCGWDIPGDATQKIGRLAVKAADTLVALQQRVRELERQLNDESVDACMFQTRAERAEAELAQARKDAERYRWLMGAGDGDVAGRFHAVYRQWNGENGPDGFTAALDAARAQAGKP